jgi:hypothetical protein
MTRLFSFFHLNMAFSSIPEERRAEVIRRCYWPLLHIVENENIPLAIEASGYTLEVIQALDAAWIAKFKTLLQRGACEFIGCGYAQVIGPLVPARVNAENLKAGNAVYQRILGMQPAIALVNEQAYSAGMVQHYLDAGYEAIIMEWDNAARSHPHWNPDWRYFPQYAMGVGEEKIPVIWNKSIAFQKFQRYAHGEITEEQYLTYLAVHASAGAFPFYGNDAECFDFRPGRFMTEAPLTSFVEWERITALLKTLHRNPDVSFIKPSGVLELMQAEGAGHCLHLESPSQPLPVKKQDKYNPLRWAVTGRDNLGINTACWKLADRLGHAPQATAEDWKELCYLWSSDFRTHITEPRWLAYQERLQQFSAKWPALDASKSAPSPASDTTNKPAVSRIGKMLQIKGQRLELHLNCQRGLAVDRFIDHAVSPLSLFGTLEHGFYDHIQWGADFYSGHLVFEAPGKAKTTDLVATEPDISWDGAVLRVTAKLETGIGLVTKTWCIDEAQGRIGLSTAFTIPEPALGSLRLGHLTLNPDAFANDTLFFRTHNGGSQPETFRPGQADVSHGRAVSFLVSANQAIGMTEGQVQLGDAAHCLTMTVDKSASALIGLIASQPVKDSHFFRLALTAAELDDTSKPINSRSIHATVWIAASKTTP